jgi:hypothetical protein
MLFGSSWTTIRVEVGTVKALLAALSLALLIVPATQVTAASSSSRFTYHWPVKPFNQQHPVRAAFGEPRIVSTKQPFGQTGPGQSDGYSFHNGIDIVAAPGARVYPVVTGRVVRAKPGQIVVHTNDGRSFQYYHLTAAPAVRIGKTVVAGRTVLGWIRPDFQHVHLAEIDGPVVHNPLDPGHLEPYGDLTRPIATELYLTNGSVARPLDKRAIGPGNMLAVAAADPPTLEVPAPWDGLPQAPALVEWRLFRGQTGTPWRIAVDSAIQSLDSGSSGRSTGPAPTRTAPPSPTASITTCPAATSSGSTSTRIGCSPVPIGLRFASPTHTGTGRPPGGRS